MKVRTVLIAAVVSLGIAAASAPAYAGKPGFCPQVDSAVGSFFWHLTHHLPIPGLDALFGVDGVCSR